MASVHDEPPILRCDSPSPEILPTRAIGACPDMSRCLSTSSTLSHGSATTDASNPRDSLGSNGTSLSRQSSASFQSSRLSDVSFVSSRQSMGSFDRPSKRRGYVRPQPTDFAASAKSRESVLSLGSIAHLQYYFARTGLLDGKGGQVARKKQQQQRAHTFDFSALDPSSFASFKTLGSDSDSSYASMGSSPELGSQGGFSGSSIVESPVEEHGGYDSDDFEEPDPSMLPPTTSTYNHREKPVPKPPTILELKADLTGALANAHKALDEAKNGKDGESVRQSAAASAAGSGEGEQRGWFELQGMHILDVMTLAIRAAKVYYTAHEQPDRLDAIKSEKTLRAELLSVMEVLKRMATRAFAGGLRPDEIQTMESWIQGVHSMLQSEEEMAEAELAMREKWDWLGGDWAGREVEREFAFMTSILGENAEPLPPWTLIDRSNPPPLEQLPTPFLQSLQNGLRLVELHNAAVRKSRRRFGAIPTFHTDTQKPYRCADNLRYWIKAAELRWETFLKVDALEVVYNGSVEAWIDFEAAILQWCRKVREEIAAELSA